MSDGAQLRQSWYQSLNDAESHFRRLLTSPASSEWRRVSVTSDTPTSPTSKGKGRPLLATSNPELADVVVHRSSGKTGDGTWRAVLDVPVVNGGETPPSLDGWKAVLVTPELRKDWDPALESANVVEMFDQSTRISRTNFALGWPANPRDAIVISRTFNDNTTIIDISTSLPRSPDEPAYLRPSPPYVRTFVKLFAWCIQYVQPQPGQAPSSPPRRNTLSKTDPPTPLRKPTGARIRITCFWSHDLRAAWPLPSAPATLATQLASMVLGLHRTVQKRGARIPVLSGYGNGVSVERVRFALDREALTVDYAIVHEEEGERPRGEGLSGYDELQALKEAKRLTRTIECELPTADGWDVQISTKASRAQVQQLPWQARAIRTSSPPSSPTQSEATKPPEKVTFSIAHSTLPDDHSVLKVRATFERSVSSGLRLNGLAHAIVDLDVHDKSLPAPHPGVSESLLQDAMSTAEMSFRTMESATSGASGASTVSNGLGTPVIPPLPGEKERTPGAEKSILSRVKRNYIYFSSLLQEPDAKWKRTTEAKGVEVTQLDSIDPTLVVYRAEATFVGVGIWDLFASIVSPGARVYWDRLHEDAVLLEDVNELSSLWHFKTKPAWPVVGRDAIMLTTAYKSASAIHVFSFSVDDPHLFPNLPAVPPGVIRTQVDLYGWSIEALSPTTTLVTLLEQSDPKGWSNKASIPQQMIASLAGIGEFTIKCGGPPVVTRLAGARVTQTRYDHERAQFRIEYNGAVSRRSAATQAEGSAAANSEGSNGRTSTSATQMPIIELELRCDLDQWASALDIVIDPPPQNITCLRRHKLSTAGGGLWITVTHDAVYAGDERILAIVRKGPGREKGLVMVNGARVQVDSEDLPESEVKSLARQKRTKPVRIPLDQPPVLTVTRRRRVQEEGETPSSETPLSISPASIGRGFLLSSPRLSSPLANFFTLAAQSATSTTQQAIAAVTPNINAVTLSTTNGASGSDTPFPVTAPPAMQYALDALGFVKDYYTRPPIADDWTLLSDKGFPVHRKICPTISSNIPVHRGEKVIECVSAEEIAAVLTTYGCRKHWDDRFDSASIFEEFGSGMHTAFIVTKGGFPFRDRGFFLANLMARTTASPAQAARSGDSNKSTPSASTERRSAVLCVSASFSPDSVASFQPTKYNPYALPVGRVLIDAWILETLDPYAAENFAIPSTRCTRLVAVDYAGSVPAAVNSMINAALPRTILSLETYMKALAAFPLVRLPSAGVVLSDRKSVDDGKSSWMLRRRDHARQLVAASYGSDTRTYQAIITVTMAQPPARQPRAELDTTHRAPRLAVSLSGDEFRPRLVRKSSEVSISGSPPLSPRRSPPLPNFIPASQDRSSSYSAVRGSSTLTIRGEVRPAPDLLVGELVIDSKLYPNGCRILVTSAIRDPKSKYVALEKPASSTPGEGPSNVLPLAYAAFLMPSSPLHSSGLSADKPTRHLLRLTLPTAQYQWPTIQDPLTGETRAASAKPQWFLDLQEGSGVVSVAIEPLEPQASLGTKSHMPIVVNGEKVAITSESEASTNLGRDELTDERISKMTVLTRVDEESDTFPPELNNPLGIGEHLLDPSSSLLTQPKISTVDVLNDSAPTNNKDSPVTLARATAPAPETVPPTTHGLLSYLPSGAFARLSALSQLARLSTSTPPAQQVSVKTEGDYKIAEQPGPLPDDASTASSVVAVDTIPSYPLHIVLAVALISFLIGSLLRSLLSPADFIYVATDLKDAGEESGWREIKRLFEVKYLVGGWDFQVAVVRRH